MRDVARNHPKKSKSRGLNRESRLNSVPYVLIGRKPEGIQKDESSANPNLCIIKSIIDRVLAEAHQPSESQVILQPPVSSVSTATSLRVVNSRKNKPGRKAIKKAEQNANVFVPSAIPSNMLHDQTSRFDNLNPRRTGLIVTLN